MVGYTSTEYLELMNILILQSLKKHNEMLKLYFAKKISTNFYYLSLLFQLSVANSENFKEIKAWEVLKFLKEKIGMATADRVYIMPSLLLIL